MRNNIQCVVPKKPKSWKLLSLCNLLISKHPISPIGSNVFRSIWKAWELIKNRVINFLFSNQNDSLIFTQTSIWWNLEHKGKPLALLQGCSAKSWAQKSITTFNSILDNGQLKDWESFKSEFELPSSNWRTYTIIKEVCNFLLIVIKRRINTKSSNGKMETPLLILNPK